MESKLVLGIDEAGRGPLAGPVTAACVALRPNTTLEEVKDSKKLSKKQRNRLFLEITQRALAYSIVSVGSKRIDELNILQATRLAMKLCCERVVDKIGSSSFEVLIDGNQLIEVPWNQQAVVKGDSKIPAISAASILAKVTRDNLMEQLGERYKGYELEKHSGYPTAAHKDAIKRLGPCRIHRTTFRGVKEVRMQQSLT